MKKVNCELIGVEKVTKENARMYRPGRNWGTDGLGSSFWQAAIIEVVDIGATGHFPPLASLPHGPLERNRVHAADARRGNWV